MADEQVVPDEAYWQRLAQEKGPGFAQSMRTAYDSRQPAGPVDAPAETVPPAVGLVPPPAPPDALLPPPADMTSQAPTPTPTPGSAAPEETFTPPGPQTVSTTDQHTSITQGAKLDPLLEAQLRDSQAKELGAQAEKTRIEVEQLKKIADVEQERANEAAIARQKQEEAAAERKRVLEDALQLQRDAQKETDRLAGPVEDTIADKFRNRLAIALGAFGAGLTGGPNQGAASVAADREHKLTTWKAQYARAKGKLDNAQNLYATLRNQGLDDQSAEAIAAQRLNDGYATTVKAIVAGSKAPLTQREGELLLENIKQDNLAREQAKQQSAQNHVVTTIDKKTVTKSGGANTEERGKLLDQAREQPEIKTYREVRGALDRFVDLKRAGADGAAMAEFIAGKGGLGQGSYTPKTMMDALKKRGIIGQSVEKLRDMWSGGVPPDILKEIGDGLATSTLTSRKRADRPIKEFQRWFKDAGIHTDLVIGSETPADAAAAAGAAPSAYQGAK